MIASRHYIPLKHLRAVLRLGQLSRYPSKSFSEVVIMLTHDEARDIVDRELQSCVLPNGDDLVVLDEHTIEKPWGWVFFYQSRRFRDTGDFGYLLAGNAPYIVNRHDASIHVTGTAQPIECYIDEYEENLETKSKRWALHVAVESSITNLKSIRQALGYNLAKITEIKSQIPGIICTGARSTLQPMCSSLNDHGVAAEIIENPKTGKAG